MTTISCPFCDVTQKSHWSANKWKYAKNIEVQRFECGCGNSFNYYKSEKSNWTIPKNPEKRFEKI